MARCGWWAAGVLAAGMLLSRPAAAGGCWCANVDAAADRTIQTVNQTILQRIDQEQAAIIDALKRHAAEVSATLQGLGGVQAGIGDANNHARTTLAVQGAQAQAAQRFQFSDAACQAASGTVGVAAAQAAVAAATRQEERQQAAVSAGNGAGSAQATLAALRVQHDQRVQRYCNGSADPACAGRAGARPDADVTPTATILAPLTYGDGDGATDAQAAIERLLQATVVPGLGADQTDTAEGRAAWQRRKTDEARLNLARGILLARKNERMPVLDGAWVRAIQAQATGTPTTSGPVSMLEHQRTRFVTRYQTPEYDAMLARLETAPAIKEVARLAAGQLELLFDVNQSLKTIEVLLAAQIAMQAEDRVRRVQPGPMTAQQAAQ